MTRFMAAVLKEQNRFIVGLLCRALDAVLSKARIGKIWQHDWGFVIESYSQTRGKNFLVLGSGGVFLLSTRPKDTDTVRPRQPSSFCMFLRKHFSGKTVNRIFQAGQDRIVCMEFSNNEQMIFEVFDGNLIVLDEHGKIREALNKRDWTGRSTRTGNEYVPPTNLPEDFVNVLKITSQNELGLLVGEKDVEKFLSKNAGLGVFLSKEVLYRAGGTDDSTRIFDAVQEVARECEENISNNKAHSCGEDGKIILPIKLKHIPESEVVDCETCEPYFDALFKKWVAGLSIPEANVDDAAAGGGGGGTEEVESLKKRITLQDGLAAEFDKNAADYKKFGNLVLANVQLVENVIQKVRAKGWDAVTTGKIEGVVETDRHKGRVVLELEDQ